jgi:hypothetical protein
MKAKIIVRISKNSIGGKAQEGRTPSKDDREIPKQLGIVQVRIKIGRLKCPQWHRKMYCSGGRTRGNARLLCHPQVALTTSTTTSNFFLNFWENVRMDTMVAPCIARTSTKFQAKSARNYKLPLDDVAQRLKRNRPEARIVLKLTVTDSAVRRCLDHSSFIHSKIPCILYSMPG